MDHDEVRQLADAIDRQYRVMVLAAAYTGCRLGEPAAWRVKSLDMLRRKVTITETLTDVKGSIALGPLKRSRLAADKVSRALVAAARYGSVIQDTVNGGADPTTARRNEPQRRKPRSKAQR